MLAVTIMMLVPLIVVTLTLVVTILP
jgi:hypothetical protein